MRDHTKLRAFDEQLQKSLTKNLFDMIKIITTRSCLILLISFLFCIATVLTADAKERHSDEKITTSIKKMTAHDTKLLGKELKHPGNFKVEGIKQALQSIRYREKTLSEGKKKLIFSAKTIDQLALLINKALLTVKPDSKVSFSAPTPDGKTTGDVFALNNALILKFGTINGIPYISDSDSGAGIGIDTKENTISNWLLVPGKDQQLYSSEGFLGWNVTERNMVVANLKEYKGEEQVVQAVAEKEEKEIPEQSDKKKTIEEKLRLLKDLKKKNLISSDAYEKKVQELLDQL